MDESQYLSRSCVASSTPFEMCDRELFTSWTNKTVVTLNDVEVQLAAGEPEDSNSSIFFALWPVIEFPASTCLFALCHSDFPLLSVANFVTGFEVFLLNNQISPNSMMLISTRDNTRQLWDNYKRPWKV